MSPTFDLSLPSTSGYSSRSKSSQPNGNPKRGLNSKSSPKKNNLRKLRKNGSTNKLSFRSSRSSVFKNKTTERSEKTNNLPKRGRKRIIKEVSEEEETEKEETIDNLAIDESTNDGSIQHFDSDTEIEDKCESKQTDTDATEIEEFEERTTTATVR